MGVKVQVFTLTGKVVKTIKQTINDAGNRSCEVEWDGRDEYGDRLGRGVYLYRLTVISPDGKKKENWKNWLFSDRLFRDPIF